jgi:hypothetical protein
MQPPTFSSPSTIVRSTNALMRTVSASAIDEQRQATAPNEIRIHFNKFIGALQSFSDQVSDTLKVIAVCHYRKASAMRHRHGVSAGMSLHILPPINS